MHANDPLSIVARGEGLSSPATRRGFLRTAALGGSILLLPGVFAACDDDDDPVAPDGVRLDLSTNTGVLQYAHALEQLEAAFYARVVQGFSGSGLSQAEQAVLADIADHERIHRDFLAAALGSNALPALEVDFSSVNFGSRTSILTTARTFEDLGVAAYNGAGRRLTDATLLTIAGKIVSVEARHASAIRDLLNPGSQDFANGADANGLDAALEPAAVLQAADPFITTTITLA